MFPQVSPFISRVAKLLPSPTIMNPELGAVKFRSSWVEKGDDIMSVGASVKQIVTIGQGLAMRYRLLPDGGRQVIMFLGPGDICNPHIYPSVIDHCVAAVTPVRIDRFDCEHIIMLTTTVVGINQALWTLAEEQNAIMRNHITSLGRRDARSRVISLLSDIVGRLSAHGDDTVGQLFIPVTQTLLADAIGVTHVHFNRIVGELSKQGIVTTSRGGIMIKDCARLSNFAAHDQVYA